MARIAVTGANGNIGRRVVAEARSRGHHVTEVVRDPAKARGKDVAVLPEALDPAVLADIIRGHDVVVSALGAGSSPDRSLYRKAAEAYVHALRSLGSDAPRLIVVGGAGSLRTSSGHRVIDAPDFPDAWKPEAKAQADALDYYRTIDDVEWTYFSPAAMIGPGGRTGKYTTDTDRLVTDPEGNSRISYEDYAAALVDEIENPRHIRERFTAATV